MKHCPSCRDPAGNLIHPTSEGCNWLDGDALDQRCPHCGGPVAHLEPTPLGAVLDDLSVIAANDRLRDSTDNGP